MLNKDRQIDNSPYFCAKKIKMKKVLPILILLSTYISSLSQKTTLTGSNVNITIIALDYNSSKSGFKTFIAENGITIHSQDESKTSINATFDLSAEQYGKLRNVLNNWGFISNDDITTTGYPLELEEIDLEIEFITQKKTSFEQILQQHEMKSAQYESLWREKQGLEDRIFNLKKRKSALEKNSLPFRVSLTIMEEITSPQESKVTFVNMPGVEYSYLKIENPNDTVSSAYYQGYFLKYLFTKGKSYASVGVYQSTQKPAGDSTVFSELFVMNFGQDFYSRHFGRGSNKFGNLYSGYTVGYIAASNEAKAQDIFYLAPSVGLELFKNKYILWDTKVNYLIPFSYQRNLRGFGLNTSINFVF
ncbi:MAG: hypothetical protein RLY35_317 [Bacteroidota bacterium]